MRPVSRPKLYEQIVERIHDHVVEAGLRAGDRLPPERELAARLGVSRASVSQALVALEVLGTVSVRHGDGAVLLAPVSRLHLVAALRAHQDRLPEVIEARDALEGRLAALAAERRTEEDLAAIDAALDAMARDVAADGRGVEGDELFHAAVTRAGHSGLLARLMDEIAELVRETRLESLGQPGRPQASLASHREIAEAIRRRDAAAAARAMHAHISLVSAVALLEPDARG